MCFIESLVGGSSSRHEVCRVDGCRDYRGGRYCKQSGGELPASDQEALCLHQAFMLEFHLVALVGWYQFLSVTLVGEKKPFQHFSPKLKTKE